MRLSIFSEIFETKEGFDLEANNGKILMKY